MTRVLQLNEPIVPLRALEELWFQVTGTRCNLECRHCFISCSPHNHSFGFLSLEAITEALAESVAWGVREYYFTGGEPFMHPQMVDILERTLKFGPATVLTNGTILKPAWLERLRQAQERSEYGLEFRVSIDGPTAKQNDPIRGAGTFARAVRGVGQLVAAGFLPIITMTRTWEQGEDGTVLEDFRRTLHEQGYDRPRLKILPRLQIGAEAERTSGYAAQDRVSAAMLEGYDLDQLVCHHSRVVTDRGVYVCPILLETEDACLGTSLQAAARPYAVRHGACLTCYQYGAICTNASSSARSE